VTHSFTLRVTGRTVSAMLLWSTLTIGPAVALAAEKTARAAADQASTAAKKWSGDAVLTSISTLDAKTDGTAKTWSVTFYSPKTGKGYMVDVRGEKLQVLEAPVRATSPIGPFIDSDKAMAEAKKNGLKGKSALPMAVMAMGGGPQPEVYWTVGTAFGPGEVAVVLDSRTGKLVTRHEGN
jgi:hypothetical protein